MHSAFSLYNLIRVVSLLLTQHPADRAPCNEALWGKPHKYDGFNEHLTKMGSISPLSIPEISQSQWNIGSGRKNTLVQAQANGQV